ncbi:BrxA/BrxB family bacilliredoxin [Salibacteraceae bacterium]|nr:BrxA/BrxB family bacilliredoxin [Salibacteraceae bacterium]MDB9708658.1 BrxA/BrxB family bacilliredoxin [Salibacteraceae bacterium]MDC1220166.1 BrxA/BrxB family bacilliredoxin [bacterium]MDC1304878.1 BrxA/BrxB family bacilliredoxin [Salibacteraceae bacterium]
MYPEEIVAPMKSELTEIGFNELLTAEAVDNLMNEKSGTALIMVNSVCGCAAGNARPAVRMAIDNDKKPNKLTTVFAGVDQDAVAQARKYFLPYPPSSPSIALMKDGKLVHFIERHHIEGRPAELIAENLKAAFDEFC